MSEDFQIRMTDDLIQELEYIHDDHRTYLDSLPQHVRQSVVQMTEPDVFMSPGRLSVMALPFWIGEAFDIALETRRRIALANLYGLLHFVVQDTLTDGDYQKDKMPTQVISGTLYQQQMFAHYQRCFPPTSLFWSLLNKYWLEWAGSIAWERQVGFLSPFSDEELLFAARKAAPLKVCTSGLALLSGRENLIPDLERAVDMMHMVIQMTDDMMDLAEDLAGNRFNTLVSTLVSISSHDSQAKPDINWMGRRIYIDRVDEIHLQRMWTIAEEAQKLLGQMKLPQWADLIVRTVQRAEHWRDEQLREIVASDLQELLVRGAQEQPEALTESDAKINIGQFLSDLSSMRKIYPDYSPSTARKIFNAIPDAYRLHCNEGGRWGPGFIARIVPVNSTTVGRYLKAFRENGLKEVDGIPMP